MKPFARLDHYEVLEIPREASREEVERAYRLAVETYAEDSLAGYSLVSHADAAALRERMRDAYRTLADAEARAAYDAEARVVSGAGSGPAPGPSADGAAPPAAPRRAPVDEAFDDLEEGDSEWSGARLRRHRLRRGREIDDIAGVTKVNPGYLQCIEEERFGELPARVYVRGFVFAYAACLGLDAPSVAHSYIKRFEAGRPAVRRRRSG